MSCWHRIFFLCLACFPAMAHEKEQSYLRESEQIRERIKEKFDEAALLVQAETEEGRYLALVNEIKQLKGEKERLNEAWRRSCVSDASSGEDLSALWDVGEVTLSQLVMEYGANEYLYIIPPELSTMKLTLFSGVPLPRESWAEMVDLVLAHNGIGVKKLNNWARQLYILKLDPGAIEGISCRAEDLALYEPQSRICFILSPNPEQLKAVQGFFERFSDMKQTTVQAISTKIVLISTRDALDKLLGLYHAVWEKERGKVVRLLNLTKIAASEGEKVLKAVFGDSTNKTPRPPFSPGGVSAADDFSLLVLPQGLILVGEEELVQRGEQILSELEQQLEDPSEKVIFWYPCRHSNPDDIAVVLEKVYDSLIGATLEKKTDPQTVTTTTAPSNPECPCPVPTFPSPNPPFNPTMPVNPTWVQPGLLPTKEKTAFGNFVVDAKTASILMVVRREELAKIKSLLKKLDVPKRMVQIEVLLVEKCYRDQSQFGINLLNFGSTAELPHQTGVIFDSSKTGGGLFQFILNRNAGDPFGINLKFNSLIAQKDVRINSSPSVVAMNQTPATISIVEEISINNGTIQNTMTNTVEKSFTRAQYGTTLVLTPTIHLPDLEENPDHPGFVTMQTDISFDTTIANIEDRPDVTRRHIVNEVQVADGETVIIGGLRRKSEEDRREKIPFLGDIPGIGKLFGFTKTDDQNTEMFFFITPKIIRDPVEDLRILRLEDYKKRPGDIPEFLESLDRAKERERNRLFSSSLKMLFGMH